MPVISPSTKTDNQKIAYGAHTTVAAADTIATGLSQVTAVVASLQSDPADAAFLVSAVPSTNGNIVIKTWQNTSGSDPTPAAAGTFSKLVNWIAIGY